MTQILATKDPRITVREWSESSLHPDNNWQLIFRNSAGQDYCRETYWSGVYPDLEDIIETAQMLLDQHAHQVASVEIQRW